MEPPVRRIREKSCTVAYSVKNLYKTSMAEAMMVVLSRTEHRSTFLCCH